MPARLALVGSPVKLTEPDTTEPVSPLVNPLKLAVGLGTLAPWPMSGVEMTAVTVSALAKHRHHLTSERRWRAVGVKQETGLARIATAR